MLTTGGEQGLDPHEPARNVRLGAHTLRRDDDAGDLELGPSFESSARIPVRASRSRAEAPRGLCAARTCASAAPGVIDATLSGSSIEQRNVHVVGQDNRLGEFGLLSVGQEPDGAAEQLGWNGDYVVEGDRAVAV